MKITRGGGVGGRERFPDKLSQGCKSQANRSKAPPAEQLIKRGRKQGA